MPCAAYWGVSVAARAAHARPRGAGAWSHPALASVQVPLVTTIAGARATTQALEAMRRGELQQIPLQDYFPGELPAGEGRGARLL